MGALDLSIPCDQQTRRYLHMLRESSVTAPIPSEDRRTSPRYPMSPPVRYQQGAQRSGLGELSNISGSGLLFHAASTLAVGRRIRIDMPWPSCLDGTCPLLIRIAGSVVRSDTRGTVVRISSYEFRTMSKGSAKALTLSPNGA